MPDFWSVPIATGAITDLNQQIAKGPDYSWLGNLPNSYWAGQNQRFTQNQRDVFQNGLPRDQNGNIDWSQAADRLARVGGTSQIQNVIGLGGLGQPIDLNSINPDNPNRNTGASPAPGYSQPSTSAFPPSVAAPPAQAAANNPGNIENGKFAQSQPGYVPTQGRFASFNTNDAGTAAADHLISAYGQKGVVTPNAIAARWAPAGDGNNNPQAYGAYIAQQLGVAPDAPLNLQDPAIRQRVVQAIRQFEGNGSPAQPAQPSAQPGPGAASGLVAPGTDPLTQATAYANAAAKARSVAASLPPILKYRADALNKQADAWDDRAKQIRDQIGKYNEAYTGSEAKRFGAQYDAIQTEAQRAGESQQIIDVAKGSLNDPNFYSGPAASINEKLKQWTATLGGDPNIAQPQEAFRKAISSSILDDVRSMKGTGQIRLAEINLMQRQAASSDNTPAGNRTLLEIKSRINQRAQDLSALASQYNGGRLDANFSNVIRKYDQQHPMFTPDEISNPRLLAAPDVPPAASHWSAAQMQQWRKGIGLPADAPVRLNGRYLYPKAQ